MVDTPAIWKGITQVNTTDAPATGGTNQQYNPQITALKNGGYVVVWTDESRAYNSSGTAILGQRYDALGLKVGGEVELSRPNPGYYGQPAVTTLSNGNIAVAFDNQLVAGTGIVYVRVFDAGLNFLREDFIGGGLAGYPATTSSITAVSGGGYAVAFTFKNGAGNTDVLGQIRSTNGALLAGTFNWDNAASDAGGSEAADDQHETELATLSNGNVVAVWQDEFSTYALDNDIRFAIRGPAGMLAKAGAIDPHGGINEVKPDVAALSGGGFVVAWVRGTNVVASLFDNQGNVFGVPITTSSTAGNQHAPAVTGLADGGFLLTWNDDAVFPGAVRGQRFTALGVKVGQEFTLNNFATVQSQLNNEESAVALLGDGRAVFATNDVASPGDYDVITSIWDPRTGPVNGTTAGETLTSTPGGATVNGLGGNDGLFGRQGSDTLNGGLGADTMRGGVGNDTYIVDNAGDSVIEDASSGNDTVRASLSHTLGANVEHLVLTGSAAINGAGNALANQITGNAGANILDGKSGADTVNGEAGNDLVNGGLGNDSLTGGPGADRFAFDTAIKPKGSNIDTISDFSAGDTVLLDNAIFTKLKKEGALKDKYLELGKKADSKKAFVIYNEKNGDLSYDKNGDKKGGAILFAKLGGSPDDVSAADFLVI